MAEIFFQPSVETLEVPTEGSQIQLLYEFDPELQQRGIAGQININIFFNDTEIDLEPTDISVAAEGTSIPSPFPLALPDGSGDDLDQTNAGIAIVIADLPTPEGQQPLLTIPINPTDQFDSSVINLTTGNPSIGIDALTFIEGQSSVELIPVEENAVELSLEPVLGSEADQTQFTLTATASQAVTEEQTVDLALGGDVDAADFDNLPGEITIADGETTGTVTVTVADDDEIEGEETATFTISNPSDGIALGQTLEASVTIIDNDQLTLTVNNTNDSGEGSLRSAIAQANNSEGADTITLADNLSGETITLTSGQLEITEALTINGLGADQLTLDADGNSRVFEIDDEDEESAIAVTFNGLTLTSGSVSGDGGGILNREDLTLTSSTVSGNSADSDGGGIYNSGTISITGSTISGNSAQFGGGIYNSGTVSITSSTISNNSAARLGGGIENLNGTASITGSTINNNSAEYGGGIVNDRAMSITNSTISNNSASEEGGGINNRNFGIANLNNSTISGNSADHGGGIFNDYYGTVNISSSIIADNTADDLDLSNPENENIEIAASFSLIENNADQITDNQGNNILGEDPLLDPAGLQDNGGATQTIALQEGSPAIDAGSNPGNLAFDQRGQGFDRVVNEQADIGAFEVQEGEDVANDLVFGTLNDDSFNTSDQNPPYIGDHQIAFTGAGEDTVDGTNAVGHNRIYASSENDEILASLSDRVFTQEGDDEIVAASENRIFAGAGNDRVNASSGSSNNRVYGQAGNDDLFAGNNDVLLGGEGEDRLFIGTEGDNILTGNAGADQFWMTTTEIPNRPNTITDFTSGEDVIGFGGFPQLTFDDLTLTQEEADTIISLGTETGLVDEETPIAQLQGIQADSLNVNDFLFAAQAPV